MTSLDNIQANTKYLGDPSKADWVSSGTPLQSPDKDSVILTLSEDGESSSGTLLASTTYVWYGKITAQLKTSRGQGVVSAFILLGDNKDEIDFEFVGTDLQTAQSNFYFQGITDYMNSKNLSVSGDDTFSDYHTYEIDWKPDQITWAVDGTTQRTLKKSDTMNKTDNQYHYPQTPSRVQLSLWPAGSSKNGKGTVDWSGGLINWSQQDPQQNGYYYAMFKEVDIECYDPPSEAKKSGDKSYVWTNTNAMESDVSITDNDTVLKSLLGSGEDMDKDYPNPSGTKSGSPQQTSEVATIPGLTGAGPGTDGSRGGDSGSGGSGGDSGGSQTSGGSGATSTGIGGFSQGDSGSGSSGTKSDAVKVERVVAGSMFAALMAFIGMMIL
ncbi:uncharacterized protein KY384_001384 [Bacidia gigantensis]|uniref:uncharacterized protein n=1 Tax=Bacidia gigantensis TaxID=2732470 RepID=UPI001D0531DB|nr:uncharacterized protein KY384_001384 [Bacidia gigantensis]KAG8533643.1 hypothetical protein KY384_001384 [Bacidia gigantensis]